MQLKYIDAQLIGLTTHFYLKFYFKNIKRVREALTIGHFPDLRPMSRLFCWSKYLKSAVCDKFSRPYRNLKALIIVLLTIYLLYFNMAHKSNKYLVLYTGSTASFFNSFSNWHVFERFETFRKQLQRRLNSIFKAFLR